MAVEVIMPKMGDTVEEARIVKWLVSEGDRVRNGDALAQYETDKAVFDLEARSDGVVRRIFYPEGATVPVLSVIALIAAPGEDISAYEAKAAPRPEVRPAAAPAQAEVVPEAPAPAGEGRISASPRARKLAREGGVDLSMIQGTGPGGRIVEKDVLAFLEARPKTTPIAIKMAQEAGLDLAAITGTGPGGRITKEDVERALAARAIPPVAPPPEIIQVIPMAGVRAIIAEKMATAAHTSALVTLTTEADATELVRLREQLKAEMQAAEGLSISYNDIMVAILARALKEHPNLNATLAGDEIRLLSSINIGVAVDTERGLLVPVIKDARSKTIAEISRQANRLIEAARTGRISPDDLRGGTFTLTNLGMYEIDAFTPIINLPECAILGVGRILEKPVIYEGQVCARKMMFLSLVFDHRVVDGAPAARFLQRVKQLVERPYLLLLG